LSVVGRNLRRSAKAHACRVLAALIAVLLPLQGISGAMAAIQAPAHYHERVASVTEAPAPAQLRAPPAIEAKRVASHVRVAEHSHEAPPVHGGTASSHEPRHAPHSHHASPHRDVRPAPPHHPSISSDVPSAPAAGHAGGDNVSDRHVDARAQRQSLLVGHHVHALEDTGVVYLQGDPDRPDSSSTGKHAAAADAALTGWWMPMRGSMGAQPLPHARWRYQSHTGMPALRPPAASGVLTA